ncbi:hypothetical protein NJ69_21735 [Pseudomonas parafulva]|nr:hypothetical protein NJ69_21735 [Pseudomonas parafulva]
MRIITRLPDQPCSERVGNDVASDSPEVVFTTQRSIMEAWLPDGPTWGPCPIQCATAAGLEAAHECVEFHIAQFDQPMQVVRHQYPGQRAAGLLLARMSQLRNDRPGEREGVEKSKPIAGGGSQQIEPPWLGKAASS